MPVEARGWARYRRRPKKPALPVRPSTRAATALQRSAPACMRSGRHPARAGTETMVRLSRRVARTIPSPVRAHRRFVALMVAASCALGVAHAVPPRRSPPAGPASPALSLACPAHLATAQSAAAVPGWDAYRSPDENRLDAYGFYDGPVAMQAELAPTDERRHGRSRPRHGGSREIAPPSSLPANITIRASC